MSEHDWNILLGLGVWMLLPIAVAIGMLYVEGKGRAYRNKRIHLERTRVRMSFGKRDEIED